MLYVPGFNPGPAHKNGFPLVELPCTHVIMGVTDKIKSETDSHKLLASSYPVSIVGKYIFIFWSEDDVWYRAKVLKYLENKKKFKIIYDDGNAESIDLTQELFLVEDKRLRIMAA